MGCLLFLSLAAYRHVENQTEMLRVMYSPNKKELGANTQTKKIKHADGRDNDGYMWINNKNPLDKNDNGIIEEWERPKNPQSNRPDEGLE